MAMTTNTDLSAAKRFLQERCGDDAVSVLCAVSGGMDSMCLLHLLHTWGRERNFRVTAAHFNHQLRGAESDRDEAFVRDWCAQRQIPFVSGSGDVRACAGETGKTLEEAARDMRYAFLEEQRQKAGCAFLLTAHHADDHAETMLLNLLRGTGPRGLSGIPESRDGILRPFLRITRGELAAYAAAYHIGYVEDSTNALDDMARNVLRHQVMPVLRELNPKAVENMIRTAEMLRRDEETLDRMAVALLEQGCRFSENAAVMDADACLKAEEAVLSRAVHRALARLAGGRKDLTARHVEAVCELLRGAVGKELTLPYGLTARRGEKELILSAAEAAPAVVSLSIGETVPFGNWRVAVKESGPGLEMKIPEGAVFTVTAWDRNDRMTIPGSRGARSLKRLCVDNHISPWERDGLPVLRVDGRCVAVPGIGIDREYLPDSCGMTVYVTFIKETEENRYGT